MDRDEFKVSVKVKTISGFYEIYLKFMNPLLPKLERLTENEILVMKKIMALNLKHIKRSISDRGDIIFSKKSKDKIMEELEINQASFNNILYSLRKKNFLGKKEVKRFIKPVKTLSLNIIPESNGK